MKTYSFIILFFLAFNIAKASEFVPYKPKEVTKSNSVSKIKVLPLEEEGSSLISIGIGYEATAAHELNISGRNENFKYPNSNKYNLFIGNFKYGPDFLNFHKFGRLSFQALGGYGQNSYAVSQNGKNQDVRLSVIPISYGATVDFSIISNLNFSALIERRHWIFLQSGSVDSLNYSKNESNLLGGIGLSWQLKAIDFNHTSLNLSGLRSFKTNENDLPNWIIRMGLSWDV